MRSPPYDVLNPAYLFLLLFEVVLFALLYIFTADAGAFFGGALIGGIVVVSWIVMRYRTAPQTTNDRPRDSHAEYSAHRVKVAYRMNGLWMLVNSPVLAISLFLAVSRISTPFSSVIGFAGLGFWFVMGLILLFAAKHLPA